MRPNVALSSKYHRFRCHRDCRWEFFGTSRVQRNNGGFFVLSESSGNLASSAASPASRVSEPEAPLSLRRLSFVRAASLRGEACHTSSRRRRRGACWTSSEGRGACANCRVRVAVRSEGSARKCARVPETASSLLRVCRIYRRASNCRAVNVFAIPSADADAAPDPDVRAGGTPSARDTRG